MSATYDPRVCACSCHYWNNGADPEVMHPGLPCWCREPQAPVVVVPPKFCPHCGRALT